MSKTLYILYYSVGLCHGSREMVGIYTSQEELEKGKVKDQETYTRVHGEYKVEKVEANTNVNIVVEEW